MRLAGTFARGAAVADLMWIEMCPSVTLPSIMVSKHRAKRYRHYLIGRVAAGTLVACTDDRQTGGSGGTAEGGGMGGEDGTLTGDALVWKTDQTLIQEEVLGAGTNPTVRLYSDECTGVEHIIRLEATDSDDETTSSAPRSLVIWTLC